MPADIQTKLRTPLLGSASYKLCDTQKWRRNVANLGYVGYLWYLG